MDIFEQVQRVLKDMEVRERRNQFERQIIDGSTLAEMVTLYNRYVKDRQWEPARDCLISISRLVVSMLTNN